MNVSPHRPLITVPDAAQALPEHPIKISNRLAEHPLFEPERIEELLRRLPAKHTGIRAVETAGAADGGYKRGPRLAMDGVEAFEGLEQRRT